jgi:hypothetical protein
MCVTTSVRDLRLSQLYCRRLKPVPRCLEGSWCLHIHSQAVQESINEPSKSREIFTQLHSATRRNTRNLRSDSSITFVHTDNVTWTASADFQQSSCCYITLWKKITKNFSTHIFRGLYQNIQLSSYLFFYERAILSLIVALKAMLHLLTCIWWLRNLPYTK